VQLTSGMWGMGKKVQAENIHSYGTKGLRDYLLPMARKILDTKKIVAGIGLVENADDKITHIRAFLPDDIIQGEKELLKMAKKIMPALPVQDIDVLIVEKIGKNISGTGMDTNIIGRLKIQGEPEPENPRITRIVVLGLTQETKGNAYGIGLADFTTKAVVDGIDYKGMYANAMASTFIERVKIPVIASNEIARIFRVPPHMVGDLEKSSFSNIEQQSLEFVKYTLDPWVVRWEQALQKALLLPSEKRAYFVKFNVDGLLRGDYASRMNGYAVARQNGWMSANDIRELEDMNRIPAELGGDLYLVNGNMTRLADAGAFAGKNNAKTEGSKVEQITKTKTGSPLLELDTKR
jgi:hypothetical protein